MRKREKTDPERAHKPAGETDADLTKHNFLARMSHEMRTPLNAILGMSTIAQTSDDQKQTLHCLVKINEAAMHLLGMINDILDIAKLEAGKLKLVNSEFSFAMILQRTVDMMTFSLEAKKHNLLLDVDPNLPEAVICDGQKITQVLYNLLSNAVKFTPPEGTITLSVKKLKEDERNCTLEIKVSDTGIGISPEGLKKLFVAFEQLDGSFHRRFAGAGIGLAVSQNIIRLLGGSIRVESEPGKGSCFSFEIDLDKKEEKTEAAYTMQPKFKELSILLAEDVEINREIIISLLEDTGINIDCAENGLKALELYKANPAKYGLILMDIHMPEMDGLESAKNIRAFEMELQKNMPGDVACTSFTLGETKIPIVAMTANVFKDDMEKCLSAGMNGHMGKPIDVGELMKQIHKYLV